MQHMNDELLKRRAALSPTQLARLRQRIQQASEHPSSRPTIPVRSPDLPIPLSSAQQRLWFLQQLEPESTAYNEIIALHLYGSVDYEALRQTLRCLIERHEILRTTFPLQEEALVQIVSPVAQATIEVPLLDLQTLEQAKRLEAALHEIEQVQQQPFDLTTTFPWRVCLLQLAAQEYIFCACFHHCIVDAWSLEIFTRELMTCYSMICAGQPVLLPALPLQYGDYAVWQQQMLANGMFHEHLTYWLEKLARPLPVLAFPLDYPRPPFTSYHGARQYWNMPEALRKTLVQLCLDEQVTLSTLLLSAFAVLLSRHAGQDEVMIGLPVAGRDLPELEMLPGCFVNTLVLRIDLSGRPSFREVLHRIHAETLAASERQRLPFEKLVEALQPARDMSQHALFQALFTLQNVPQTSNRLANLTVLPVEVEVKTAKLDLSLVLRETADGVGGYLEYMTDLFSTQSMKLLLARYQLLLEEIALAPDTYISAYSLLLPQEQAMLLHQPTVQWPAKHFLAAFERQVARVPQALAVSDDTEQLSYQSLDERARRLAWALQRRGIGPEMLVGVYTERGIPWAISILALFRCGGVYLPLDPHHPGRLPALLKPGLCRYLLTTGELRPGLLALAEPLGIQVWCLDDLLSEERTGGWCEPAYHSSHLAYVIYTSGSTGEPKGAMVQHDGLLNHLYAKVQALALSERDRVAQTAAQSFDISLWQLLAPWLVGGQTRIYAHEVVADPPRLLQHLERDAITILEVVPSWLHTLLEVQAETGYRTGLHALRWLIPTGEALPHDLCTRWLQSYPQIPLLNAYGPTECSDDVTHHAVSLPLAALPTSLSVPVGRPLPNLAVYVLDRQMQPLPPGVHGEIYVAGVGVGRGYLADPARTAERFLPDPWGTTSGARLYRTGDLGFYTPDGLLVFSGRTDQQVKLRGYRIELGEIEYVLHSQPGVNACIALVREGRSGEQQLVAYVVKESGAALTSEDLLNAARAALPAYMVPTALALLDAWPLTPHGKIDRQALSRLDQLSAPLESAPYVAPGTFLEKRIATLWSALLGLPRVGIHDHFFALGGHSLLAVRLLARIEQQFGTHVSLAQFFSQPTVAELARAVEQHLQEYQPDEALPPLVPTTRAGAIPLSFTQMRQWLLEQLQPDKPLYHIVGAIHLRGKLHIVALTASLNEVVQRHEILRTAFVPGITGEPWQLIEPTCTLLPQEIDLHHLSPQEQTKAIEQAIADEQTRPFDLTRAPLLRVTILCLSAQEHILLLASHHMLFDGWSIEIFLYELGTLYTSRLTQQPSPLTPLPLQYADYALWQRQMLQGPRLAVLLAYWQAQLANLPTLALPTLRPRPTTPVFQAASVPVTLTAELSYALQNFSQREQATPFMVLLAAWQTMLARYSHQTDIVVGTPIAGRSHVQVEPLIGNFLNTLVLRTNLAGQPTFRTILERVRQTVVGAYAHQELPFEQILTALQADRDLAQNPLFQVLFAFENHPRQPVSLPGLSASFLDITRETTTFDLDLTMWEEDGHLVGTCTYNAYLFAPELVQHMRDDLVAFLTLAIAQPEQLIADLPEQPLANLPALPTDQQDMPDAQVYIAPHDTLEAQLATIWAELLGRSQVSVTGDFFALGGHSLLAVRLMARIERQLGKHLPLATIFQHRTIAALAGVIRRHMHASPWSLLLEMREPTIDLLAEATQEMETFPVLPAATWSGQPRAVLLTGATGFLGTFLLGELLARTNATVFCLVRAATREAGERRIQQALRDAQLWQPTFQERLQVVLGDLALPLLGLSEPAFLDLASQIEAIYHNGAQVHMLYPYEVLKATNVQGTRTLLDLASTQHVKPVHYISTLGIFPHKGETRIQYVSEDVALDEYTLYIQGGYAQSKWVAEKMVTLARERGLPVAIYRPGRISGHSQSGVWHTSDLLYPMLGGSIQLGMHPQIAEHETLELLPVDYVSQAIVALSLHADAPGRAFHLTPTTPLKVNDLLAWVKSYGYPLQAVEYQTWLAALAQTRTTGEENMLAPFLELLPQASPATQAELEPSLVIIQQTHTLAALAADGIVCPPIDARLLHTYLAHMVNSGVIAPPPR